MENLRISDMSNAEIKIKMVEYENEYETVKNKISTLLKRLEELDILYNDSKKELIKRKGI